MREVPFGNDGDFKRESLINRINSDLANDLGNLAQRTLSMIAKNCDGKVPSKDAQNDGDRALLAGISDQLDDLRGFVDREAIHKFIEAIWQKISDANGYISTEEPWKLKKTDPARMEAVLYTTAEAIRRIAITVQPIMPDAMSSMLDQLVVGADARDFTNIGDDAALTPGTALPAPQGIFPRYVAPEA